MHSYETLRNIMIVYESCGGVNETARRTGISRSTVQRITAKYQTLACFQETYAGKAPKIHILSQLQQRPFAKIHEHYAYILGMYLGDGHISKTAAHGAHRLLIALDTKYPQIITRCVTALGIIFPSNKVSIVERKGENCVRVSCYSQELPDIFPQDGAGKKHERDIILEDWQQHIVDQYPLEFFAGLYHSDGSRSRNVVNGTDYPRYFFANTSDDIRKLFTDTAEKLGLTWTTANERNVAISRRDDVAWLDVHLGDKV